MAVLTFTHMSLLALPSVSQMSRARRQGEYATQRKGEKKNPSWTLTSRPPALTVSNTKPICIFTFTSQCSSFATLNMCLLILSSVIRCREFSDRGSTQHKEREGKRNPSCTVISRPPTPVGPNTESICIFSFTS